MTFIAALAEGGGGREFIRGWQRQGEGKNWDGSKIGVVAAGAWANSKPSPRKTKAALKAVPSHHQKTWGAAAVDTAQVGFLHLGHTEANFHDPAPVWAYVYTAIRDMSAARVGITELALIC